jgi:ubiquitin-like-conjugating enzyme ATG10
MQETADILSAFPHLATKEFERACTDLCQRYHRYGAKQDGWRSVEVVQSFDSTFLRITTVLQTGSGAVDRQKDESEQDDVEEDDDEALRVIASVPAVIHYDIILSPVYRVPVLYCSISDPQHRYPPTMSTLYEHLIPSQFKAQTESGGVIGGITMNVRKHTTTSSLGNSCTLGPSSLKSSSILHPPMSNGGGNGSQRWQEKRECGRVSDDLDRSSWEMRWTERAVDVDAG